MWLQTDYDLPEFYDLRTRHLSEDVDFFRRLFPSKETRLLEIGSGSGRVLAPLAAAGYSSLVGVEHNAEMMKTAALKLRDTPARLLQLDASVAWDAHVCETIGTVDAVLIAFNTFHEIGPLRERRNCLRNCYAVLRETGQIVIDTRFPPFFRKGNCRVEDKPIGKFVNRNGSVVEAFVTLEANFVNQTIRGSGRYHIRHLNGDSETIHAPIQSWLTKPEELIVLAELCGLQVENRWGGYDRSPYDDESDRQIAILTRA